MSVPATLRGDYADVELAVLTLNQLNDKAGQKGFYHDSDFFFYSIGRFNARPVLL